jgi:hypothetical protein
VNDPRLYETEIALANGRLLTEAESKRVIDQLETVRHEVARWRLTLQRPGRLLIVDPELSAEIERLLAASDHPAED